MDFSSSTQVPKYYKFTNTMRHADRFSRNGSSRGNGIRTS